MLRLPASEPEALARGVREQRGGVGKGHRRRVGGEVVAAEGARRRAGHAVAREVVGAALARAAVERAVERVQGGADGAARLRGAERHAVPL